MVIIVIFFNGIVSSNHFIDKSTTSLQPEKNLIKLSNIMQSRIAIIQPTFTEAAYNHAFYVFYAKNNDADHNANITTNLNLLTSYVNASTGVSKRDMDNMNILKERINSVLPNATVTKLRDQDIADGHLFLDDSTNAFDVVILMHQEYVTQKMYDDYKRFVSNGGVIIFLDANFFYAEVNYDEKNNSITFVKGHGFQFDGKIAKIGMGERWLNTTKTWAGSNFFITPYNSTLNFKNNIFNYTQHEENYINNVNDVILVDYGGYTKPQSDMPGKIASYVLDYEKGQVIVVGIFGENVLQNKDFLDFFQNKLILYAVTKTSTRTQNVGHDSNGIPLIYYGNIIGYQRNPISTSYALIKFCDTYVETKNVTAYQYLKNNANWLVANAKQYGNYSLFEYTFPYIYNLVPPWHSAFAQGLALQSLVRAYQVTYNGTYLSATEPFLNSLYVDIEDGGVTHKTDNQGWWYEEYAQKGDGINPRVLNGMMYTLVYLHDYYNYTGNAKAKFLFDQGILALKNNIDIYDVGDGHSYYDSSRTVLASPYYQKVHTDLLVKLYEITEDPIFKKYYDKWSHFTKHVNVYDEIYLNSTINSTQ